MKKLFTLSLLAAAIAFTGCESLGLKTIKMDSEDSVKRISETVKKHIKSDEYKPVSLYWYEREELSNSMEYLQATMVGTDGKLYTQIFKIGGDNQGPAEVEESRNSKTYDFATVKFFAPEDIVPATIVGWINEGKTMLPEGYSFESVKGYTYKIDPENGEKTSSFDLRITEDGSKTSVQGRNIVTTYYEVEFDVNAAGTVEMEELE